VIKLTSARIFTVYVDNYFAHLYHTETKAELLEMDYFDISCHCY